MREEFAIETLTSAGVRAAADDLAAVLVDCVEGGASVSFMAGLSLAKARAFWLNVAQSAETDARAVIVARRSADARVVGVVQLIPAGTDNQPHRADISKMLVARAARRQGLGARLMAEAEAYARRTGKALLTLDTASAEAERLYRASGFLFAGTIPNYALNPDGSPCDTHIFYKPL